MGTGQLEREWSVSPNLKGKSKNRHFLYQLGRFPQKFLPRDSETDKQTGISFWKHLDLVRSFWDVEQLSRHPEAKCADDLWFHTWLSKKIHRQLELSRGRKVLAWRKWEATRIDYLTKETQRKSYNKMSSNVGVTVHQFPFCPNNKGFFN